MASNYPCETASRDAESIRNEATDGAYRTHSLLREDDPSRCIFEHLVDKWALLVVIALTGHPTRFNQLGRAIGGVSQKGLSQTLRRLERDGVVCRVVIATAPVAVEYSLTELGRTLADAIAPFATWAVIHADAVSSARLRHDADSPLAGRVAAIAATCASGQSAT